MGEQTLSDVKVLDFTWYIAGPYCTRLLGDYGAEVLKIERPPDGDPARRIGPFLDDDPHPEKSLLFSHLNLNKKCITLDLKSREGVETCLELAREVDIVVESFRPGVMDRLGLGYESLRRINPALVVTSISNFGQSGPYRDFKLSELVLNGIGADMFSSGIPGRPPLKQGGNCLQYQVGNMAAAATLAAYWLVQNGGPGQYLDISMQEVLAADTDHKTTNLVGWAYSGMAVTVGTLGRKDLRETAPTILPMGVYPCKDGYVRAAGDVYFWERFVKLFPELEGRFRYPDDVIDLSNKPVVDALWYEWCLERTKEEIMEACQAVKYMCMAVNTPMDCIESPQLRQRGYWVEVEHPVTGRRVYPGDPLHAEGSRWEVRMPAPLLGQHNDEILVSRAGRPQAKRRATRRPEKPAPGDILPLQGVRVVDRGVVWAGPTAAWLLGTLGAEVIHVDNPHHAPDFSRGFTMWPTPAQLERPEGRSNFPAGKVGARPWNRVAFYNRALWNRLSCCIDLSKAEGREVFLRLIRNSDVFLENNSATAMEHLGLGHEVLMEVNPRLICINMPAWGRSGPYKDFIGWGAMHQAVGGEEWIRGYNDDEHPFHNTFRFHMDSAGAAMAVVGAILGLIHRKRTGRGQWIDFAQMQACIAHYGEIYMDAAWNGRNQRTLGNRHPTAIQGCYPCRGPQSTPETSLYGGERWINITLHDDEEWRALCRVMGDPEWSRNERFATHLSRRAHQDELDRCIETFTRTRDNFELFYVLQQHGVTAGPVEDPRDAHMDPQLNARGFFLTIAGEDIGTYRYPGFPWRFLGTPLRVTHPPCKLGEDNAYVYREVMGLRQDEIARLEAKGVIGQLEYDWAGPMPDHIARELEQDT